MFDIMFLVAELIPLNELYDWREQQQQLLVSTERLKANVMNL
jgi:hypothetical protein